MTRLRLHPESHLVSRIGWLRAAVLGANDGIISTASLIVGVAAAAAKQNDVLIAAVAGLARRHVDGSWRVSARHQRGHSGTPNRYLPFALSRRNCSSHFRYSSASP